MGTWRVWFLASTVVLTGPLALGAGATEITLDQAPAAVQATVKREAGPAVITQVEVDTQDGRTVYQVEWIDAGNREIEITVDANGNVLPPNAGGDKEKKKPGEKK